MCSHLQAATLAFFSPDYSWLLFYLLAALYRCLHLREAFAGNQLTIVHPFSFQHTLPSFVVRFFFSFTVLISFQHVVYFTYFSNSLSVSFLYNVSFMRSGSLFYPLMYLQCLEYCLIWSKFSINIYWISELMNKENTAFFVSMTDVILLLCPILNHGRENKDY